MLLLSMSGTVFVIISVSVFLLKYPVLGMNGFTHLVGVFEQAFVGHLEMLHIMIKSAPEGVFASNFHSGGLKPPWIYPCIFNGQKNAPLKEIMRPPEEKKAPPWTKKSAPLKSPIRSQIYLRSPKLLHGTQGVVQLSKGSGPCQLLGAWILCSSRRCLYISQMLHQTCMDHTYRVFRLTAPPLL